MTRKNRLKAKVLPFATTLAAVGDVNRLAILYTLAHRSMDVREIIDITGIPGSLMTHHLNNLYKAEWVTKKKYGKRIEYQISEKKMNILYSLFNQTPLGRDFTWK
jgi:DNA-binding transcriptional ArsR family regulator